MFFEGPNIREKNSLNFSVKLGTVFLKKLGSDLVVQSSREGYPEQNFALDHLGMVPVEGVLKDFQKPYIFITFSGGRKWENT